MKIDQEMLERLPEPVARSLRGSGALKSPIPSSVTVEQTGAIRTAPGGRWLGFSATEDYRLGPPEFRWDARLRAAGITLGRVADSFQAGHGRMHVRVLGLFTPVDESGPEIDQGSLVRWLNETMWFPAVWATDVISWEPIDGSSALGKVTAGSTSAEGTFVFDESGRLVDFGADRVRLEGSNGVMTRWSTPITDHATFGGVEVPAAGSAVWHLPDGDFEYIRIRAVNVRYRSN